MQIERKIGSIDFEGVIAAVMSHAEKQRPDRQPKLCDVVSYIKKTYARFRSETDGSGPNLDLSPGIAINPQIVANGQSTIHCALDPVTLSAGLKRDRALHKADSSGPRWRVLIVTLVLSRRENCRLQQQQDCRCKTCNGKSCAYVFHKVPCCGHHQESGRIDLTIQVH